MTTALENRGTTAVKRVLHGAVDMHCHSSPSPMPRRITHVQAASQAAELGFRAMVVKCHYHNTVFDLDAMRDELTGLPIEVFGGVALNSQVEGSTHMPPIWRSRWAAGSSGSRRSRPPPICAVLSTTSRSARTSCLAG